jgi:formylglycine-generating enzyme required for sulfatase activity
MRSKYYYCFIMLALLAGVRQAVGQGSQFFRISGPAPTTILSFNPDGTLLWSNAQPNGTYTIQSLSSLTGVWVNYLQLQARNRVNTNQLVVFNPPAGMAFVPAGSFTIGNSIGDSDITDANPITVDVSAFYMDVNLVSSNQWQSVYNWATNKGYSFDNPGSGKAADQPVVNVDWFDCVKWSNARSQQAGLTPLYYTDAAFTQIYTNGQVQNPYVLWTANGFRLPTEAEWEKAARGGLSGQRFPWGDTISEIQANYGGDPSDINYDLGPGGYNNIGSIGGTDPATSPVGSFPANDYGLFDMAGNVEEWCWDWYAGPPYPAGSPYLGGTDPRGPASSSYGENVLRGGNWSYDARASRTAYRDYINAPAATYQIIGFRCVTGL